jgi:hypothetical protein
MDTNTVFKIIEQLDAFIEGSNRVLNSDYPFDRELLIYEEGRKSSIESFRNHLQEYIESEVSKAEDQMNEGRY